MKKSLLRLFIPSFAALLLSACLGPQTPLDVSKAFWQAVIHDAPEKAVEYSTLTSTKSYDGFGKDWSGYQPTWGRIVIDGDKASVDVTFSRPGKAEAPQQAITTYLVRRNQVWLVDYAHTAESVHGGVLGSLFSTLNQVGNDVSKQLQASANAFSAEMARLGKELEAQSNALNQQATESLQQYAEQLRKSIKALQESIDRALRDHDKQLTDRDKQALHEVSADLDKDNEKLAEPTAKSIADSGRDIGAARVKLNAVDGDALSEYKKQWRELSEQFEEDVQTILDDLSAQTEGAAAKH